MDSEFIFINALMEEKSGNRGNLPHPKPILNEKLNKN